MVKQKYSLIDLLMAGYVTKAEQKMDMSELIRIRAATKYVKLQRTEAEDVTSFMSMFGSDVYIIEDADIEFLKNGGVLCNLGEYGLLIAHRCVVDAAIEAAQEDEKQGTEP